MVDEIADARFATAAEQFWFTPTFLKMAIIVTLQLYSGRSNPTWELTEAQEHEWKERMRGKRVVTDKASPARAGRLGYRGFTVYTVGDLELPLRTIVFDGILDRGDSLLQNFLDGESELELFLLGTTGPALTDGQRDIVAEQIAKNVHGGSASSIQKFALKLVPPYNPGKWNNDLLIRVNNNCYNYANDKITNTFAQPGKGSGQVAPFPYTCSGSTAASQRDRQVSIANPNSTPAQGHHIALVVWPGANGDYHWYRLDSNAMWSHKQGGDPARNTDDSGDLIADPEICDRGPYTQFCGYFHCIPANTTIA